MKYSYSPAGPSGLPTQASPVTPGINNPANVPDWAKTLPPNIVYLLRQLSANAGATAMPGGLVGAVQIPAFGSGRQPVMNPDPLNYGQGGGEATFFNQLMRGGMGPIAAQSPIGIPRGWNPFNIPPTAAR